jgi:tetratricopeptide (TPR) repeat protein
MRFLIKILLSTILFCAVTALVHAQKPMQYVKLGDEAADLGRWDEAYSYYEQAFLLDSTDFKTAYKFAEAARNTKDYELALRLYDRNYEKDNGKLEPDALYWMAHLQKMTGRYEDAQRNFKKYLKKHKSSGSKALLKRADQEVKSALWAMNYKPRADELTAKKSQGINSDQSEIAPFRKEGTLYFSSSGYAEMGEGWKLMKADMDDHKPQKIKAALTSDGIKLQMADLFVQGNDVYFCSNNGEQTNLYCGLWQGDEITNCKALDMINQSGSNSTMPSVVEINGEIYLFFASDREGGEGGYDIWISVLQNNDFQKPKNAGRKINTYGDELTPFYHNGILYFSSDWIEGFGGQDIFMAKGGPVDFQVATNIGPPFNSSYNDIFYFKESRKGLDYFSSNRPDSDSLARKSTCCNDIYEVRRSIDLDSAHKELDSAAASSKNSFASLEELNFVLPVRLYFHNDEPGPKSWDTTTVVSYLESYESYLKLIPEYKTENARNLSGTKAEEAETLIADFFELKVNKGLDDLKMFSDLLLIELEKGNSIEVRVRGFASPRARTDYNLNLTKRRTASLVNYFQQDKSGAFEPYINGTAPNGAMLTFQLLPFGENKSDKSVSDDLADVKNSVYSRSAALERKIEVQSAVVLPTQTKPAIVPLKLNEDYFNFGKIDKNKIVHHDFILTNNGSTPMVIDSAIASCGCTEPKLAKSIILPGESVTMDVGFDPFGKKGKEQKTITLYIAGQEPRVITIEADIE